MKLVLFLKDYVEQLKIQAKHCLLNILFSASLSFPSNTGENGEDKMPATVHQILDSIHAWAPPETKMDYDNVGLLVGSKHKTVENVLICLDVTKELVEEAQSLNIDLIVAHHPLIFQKLARITPDNDTGEILYPLIKNDIAVIAAHTNLDAAKHGVSFVLAETIGLDNITFLAPATDIDETGMGALGEFDNPMPLDEFLDHIACQLDTAALRYSGNSNLVQRVAVCGGAGSFLIDKARQAGADAFITGDIKYHSYFSADNHFIIVDVGHYESEIPIVHSLKTYIQSHVKNVFVTSAQTVTNPMNIHIPQISNTYKPT